MSFGSLIGYLIVTAAIFKILFSIKNSEGWNTSRNQKTLGDGMGGNYQNEVKIFEKQQPTDSSLIGRNITGELEKNPIIQGITQNKIARFAAGAVMGGIGFGTIPAEIVGKKVGEAIGNGVGKIKPHLRKITKPVVGLGNKVYKAANNTIKKGKEFVGDVKDAIIEEIPEDTRRKIKFYTTLGVEKGRHYAVQASKAIHATQGYKLGKRGLIMMKGAITPDTGFVRYNAPRGTAQRLYTTRNEIQQQMQQLAQQQPQPQLHSQQENVNNLPVNNENEEIPDEVINEIKDKENLAQHFGELDYSNENDVKTNLEKERAQIVEALENERDPKIKQEMERDINRIDEELKRISESSYSNENNVKTNLEKERAQLIEALENEKDPNGKKEIEMDIARIDEELKSIKESNSSYQIEKLEKNNELTLSPQAQIFMNGVKEGKGSHSLSSKDAIMYSNLKKKMLEQELLAEESKSSFNRAEIQEYIVPAIQEATRARTESQTSKGISTNNEKNTIQALGTETNTNSNSSYNPNSDEIYQNILRAIEKQNEDDKWLRIAAREHANSDAALQTKLQEQTREALDNILNSDKMKDQFIEKIFNTQSYIDRLDFTEETKAKIMQLETQVKKANYDIKKIKENGLIDDKTIEDIAPLIKEQILKAPQSQLAREFLGEEGFKELSTALENNVQEYNKAVEKYIENNEANKDALFYKHNIEKNPGLAQMDQQQIHKERVKDDKRRNIRDTMEGTNINTKSGKEGNTQFKVVVDNRRNKNGTQRPVDRRVTGEAV